jgi:hypothetical protein
VNDLRRTGPPEEIGGATVLRLAVVDENVRPTGATKHLLGAIVGGELVPGRPLGPFAALAIVRYSDCEGYYLLYLDEVWDEVTDTWHETVEDAMRQAEWEYQGITEKWVVVSPDLTA